MAPLRWSIANSGENAADLLRSGAARARRMVGETSLEDLLPANARRLGIGAPAPAGGIGPWGWALLGIGAAMGAIVALQLADIRRYVKMRMM